MKKMKLASIAVAALFAVSPAISLTQNVVVSAATTSHTDAKDVFRHFLSGVNFYENNKKVSAVSSLNNTTLTHGTETIDNSSTDNLIDGQYRIQSSIMITGFTPSTHDRSFDIVNESGNIIGSAIIPANSSLAQGSMDFTFNIKNGKIGKTNLGSIGTKSSKKKVTKKHTKKRHKKTTKKRKASRKRSHKKSKKRAKRR